MVELRRRVWFNYAVIPLMLWVIGQAFSFYLTRYINRIIHGDPTTYFDASIFLDDIIPLMPIWIVVYILTYVFWAMSFIWISQESREMCYRAFAADLLAKIVCAVIFLTFPTYVERPIVETESVFTWLLNLIYTADESDNLFPSMHCSVSWLAMRYVLKCRKIPRWYKYSSVVITLMIFASVVFTKQHVFVDILGGLAVAEICVQVSERSKIYRLYHKLDLRKLYERK